ncbi:FixH family protein [Alkalihalobacterium bogoriense]|uniref:FixH family protein n=1 Tax=Alkalihalobacterium bogoriense TaxID=246272 RepID=UPI00068545BA|nr:FixH family protein [Alkalihalobacterium bogoriense]
MNVEKIIFKHPKTSFFLAIAFILVTTWVSYTLIMKETLQTNWKMTVVEQARYQTGEATSIQIFLHDQWDEALTNAKVSLTFDMPEMVHHLTKPMHHVEDGLYEAEVIFSMPGTWIGQVEVSDNSNRYVNQFLVKVEGDVMPESRRDPKDEFDFSQPIPNWLLQEVNQ